MHLFDCFSKTFWNSKHMHDQSIQSRQTLFCHVIVNSYLCNVLCKILIIMRNQRAKIKEQTPQLTLLYQGRIFGSSHWSCSVKKQLIKNSPLSTGNTCVEVSFFKKESTQVLQLRPAILLKRDPNTGVFLWILWIV